MSTIINREKTLSFHPIIVAMLLLSMLNVPALCYAWWNVIPSLSPSIAPIVSISNKLSTIKKISSAPYSGCESIVLHNGAIYTGVDEGKILKMNDSGIYDFVQLSPDKCASISECGRPLGMRLTHDEESLMVVDAYLGLFSVSLSTGRIKKLFPIGQSFDVTFFNDLDILPDGNVIVTQSSTRHPLHDLRSILFEVPPSGRVLHIDILTGQYTQLLDGLSFSNGVQLHSDGKSVLVAETLLSRVVRLNLNDGSVTVFIDNLPGFPDNIRASPRGGYWVPISRGKKHSSLQHFARLVRSSHSISWLFARVMHIFNLFKDIYSDASMLLLLDDDGKIVEIMHDSGNSVANVAEVEEHNGVLYTGSYFLPFIGRLEL